MSLKLALVFSLLSACVCSELDYNKLTFQEDSLFPTLPIAAPWSENEQCRQDSRMLMQNLSNRTDWAVRMWDSSAKSESGQLLGNIYQGGNFDECLTVTQPIRAQYCGVTIRAYVNGSVSEGSSIWRQIQDSRKMPVMLPRDTAKWGLCIPSSCTSENMLNSIRHHLNIVNNQTNGGVRYSAYIDKDYCQQIQRELTADELVFWCLSTFLIFLVLASTVIDVKSNDERKFEESKGKRLLMAFSFRRNMKTFMRIPRDETTGKLRFLNTMKCLMMPTAIFLHRIVVTGVGPVANRQKSEQYAPLLTTSVLTQSDVLIEIFFFVSGFLAWLWLEEKCRKGLVNPVILILRRFVRLAPLYYFMVWFHASAFSRFGSGPLWPALKREEDFCKANWWTNILFVNNYVNVEGGCMLQSWYIPCDFHLFIVTVLLVCVIKKNEKFGLYFLGALTAGFLVVLTVTAYTYRLIPMLLFHRDVVSLNWRENPTWKYSYIPTHNRGTVYFLGVLTGYIVTKTKDAKITISKVAAAGMIVSSLVLCLTPVLYSHYSYYILNKPYDVVEWTILTPFRKISFGLGLSIYLLCRYFGNIRILELIDSNFFIRWSKLTFAMYLVHIALITTSVSKRRVSYHFDEYDLVMKAFNDVAFSTIYGFLLYMAVELPFQEIFNESVFKRHVKKGEVFPICSFSEPSLSSSKL